MPHKYYQKNYQNIFSIYKYLHKTNKILFTIYFLHIKMPNKYYQKIKEKPQKEAQERYQNLSKEEKNKKTKNDMRKVSKSY